MTEEEAKTKWCFMTAPFGTKDVKCIASACMGWRWTLKLVGHDPKYKGADAAAKFSKTEPPQGVCGVASVPK